tara:strand:+ start:480 stop:614 length:135 start_codon:yes stop_codon:yes gene_type:complete
LRSKRHLGKYKLQALTPLQAWIAYDPFGEAASPEADIWRSSMAG